MRSHQLSCADVATHESLPHYYMTAQDTPIFKLGFCSQLHTCEDHDWIKMNVGQASKVWGGHQRYSLYSQTLPSLWSHRQTDRQLDRQTYKYLKVLKTASVVVPTTKSVSRTTFCLDDTNADTHKVKTLPASTVMPGKKIGNFLFVVPVGSHKGLIISKILARTH